MGANSPIWLLGLLAVFLCLSLFMVAMLDPPADRQASELVKEFFAPSYLVMALWTGYGLILIGSFTARSRSGYGLAPPS